MIDPKVTKQIVVEILEGGGLRVGSNPKLDTRDISAVLHIALGICMREVFGERKTEPLIQKVSMIPAKPNGNLPRVK